MGIELNADFWSGLGQIILVNILLSGDNALVIAMACRNLEKRHQKPAILAGSAGAIVLRIIFVLIIDQILKVPYLKLIGGALLLWIGVKLVQGDEEAGEDGVKASSSLLGAMKTIIIADAVMGIDNVLAIAGASHGSFLLVVLGLLISVPVVVWGSGVVLRLIERFPLIIYGGAAVLAYTAAHMIVAEPVLKPFFSEQRPLVWAVYAAVFVIVLGGGWLVQRRRQQQPA